MLHQMTDAKSIALAVVDVKSKPSYRLISRAVLALLNGSTLLRGIHPQLTATMFARRSTLPDTFTL